MSVNLKSETEGRSKEDDPARDNMDKPNYLELSYLLQLGSNLLPSNHLDLSPAWQTWFVRGQSGVLLMSCFYTIVMLGPPGLLCLAYIVQLASYHEVMELGHYVTKVDGLWNWSWLLLMVANLYFSHPVIHHLLPFSPEYIPVMSYVLYLTLVVKFVLSIRSTSQCLTRYCLFAWCHMAVLFLTVQIYLLNRTLRHGMVWYIFSMCIITVNDIAAYMFGFFLGSTPLTVLSPKKTVEGFVGGGLVTVVLGPLLGLLFLQYPSILCSVTEHSLQVNTCDPTSMPLYYSDIFFGISPFLIHCLAISVFACTVGPVAGFFCSGFKRACDSKNFGSLIPGHGGVLDRCDCMFLMASFTFMYLENFVHM